MSTNANKPKNVPDQRRRSIEAGLRALLALFATTLGFGLKRIIDVQGSDIVDFHWPIFLMVAVTFARFLAGSAIHMTYEYAREDVMSPDTSDTFIFDIVILAVFGAMGMLVCYAPNVETLLLRMAYLSAIAMTWAILRVWKAPSGGTVRGWRFLRWFNFMGAILFIDLFLIKKTFHGFSVELLADLVPGWNFFWLIVVLLSLWFFVIDIRGQLEALHKDDAVEEV